MFVVVAGNAGGPLLPMITAMGEALRGATGTLGVWADESRGLAVAGRARGIQAEDVFDRQPYVDERVCFVADGYVDDRGGLAAALRIEAADAAAMSDSELLYRAFLRYGEELPRLVYGSYSFAAVDRASGRVLVSDDHVGSKAVYYAVRAGALIAGSQLGALLANPAVERRPNLTALPLLVAPKVLRDVTSVDDVFLLRGGHTLRFSPGEGVSTKRWWHPEALPAISYATEREYIEHIAEILEASVVRAISAVGGAASTLSGGLDSSLVAAIAARQMRERGERLPAFTSVPEEGLKTEYKPNWDVDESPLTEELAQKAGNIDLTLVRPSGRCYLDIMPEIHAHSYTAVRNNSNHLWSFTMAEQTRALGKRVLLVGSRGNATLSFEGRLILSTLFASGDWFKALSLARRDGMQGGLPAWKALALELRARYHLWRSGDAAPAPAERAGAYLLSTEFREANRAMLDERVKPLRVREGHVQFATLSGRFPGADTMTHFGVESRDPLSDRKLIETILAVPPEVHMAGGRGRGLARELGSGVVPDSIRLRRNRGAQSPEAAFIIQKHAARYREARRSLARSKACTEIFDLEAASTTMERLAAGEGNLVDAYSMERLIDAGTLIGEWGF